MAGAALGRMWATNPRLACFFQSAVCVLVAGFLLSFLSERTRDWTLVVILGVFEAIEGGSVIWFTRDAIKHGWTRSDY